MHSLGNDFVMLDGVSTPLTLSPEVIRRIADRHHGIGCDQLIVAEPCADGADFFMRIYNTDGSESGQCGNGARCFSRFVREQGLTEKTHLEIETISTRFTLSAGTGSRVSAKLAEPVFELDKIPFRPAEVSDDYSVSVGGRSLRIGVASMGNPHAVLLVDDIDEAPVAETGPAIEHHPDFPERTNVGFVQIQDRTHLKLRVWERGVGETLACGSGACAAASAKRRTRACLPLISRTFVDIASKRWCCFKIRCRCISISPSSATRQTGLSVSLWEIRTSLIRPSSADLICSISGAKSG